MDRGFGSVVCLGEFRCKKTLLKDVSGEQFILLRTPRRIVQIRCVGEDIRINPFAIEIAVDRFPEVESRQKLIRRVADLYRNHRFGGSNHEWTVEAMRHRDALAAFDLRQRGCNYQDIARFLNDEKIVDEEWANPNRTLKNRTIRSTKRGVQMVNGGYRALLK